MNHYFISFSHTDGRGAGFGSCQIDLAQPIRSMADINVVAELLRRGGINNPVVISFTRFDADTAEQGGTR